MERLLFHIIFCCFFVFPPALEADDATLENLYNKYADEWQKYGDQHLDTLSRQQQGLEAQKKRTPEWAILTLFLIEARFNDAVPSSLPAAEPMRNLQRAAKESDFLNFRIHMLEALIAISQGKIPEAMGKLTRAEELAETTGSLANRAEAMLATGRLMFDTGRQDLAIQRLETLGSWLEKHPDQIRPLVQEQIRVASAFIYDYQGKSERAITILEDVIKNLRRHQIKSADIVILLNLATLKKKSSSAPRVKQAVKLFEETMQLGAEFGIEFYVGISASALAGIHRMNKDFVKADRYAKQGIEILQRYNPTLATLTKSERAYILVELGRWDEAEAITRELEGVLPKEYVEAYVSFLEIKIRIASRKGEWQKAFQLLNEQSSINQQQAKLQKTKDVTEAEARLGIKLEEQKNRLLAEEKDLEKKKNRISQQHNQLMTYGMVGGLFFVIALAGSLIALYHDHHKVRELQHYITEQVLQRFLPPHLVADIVEGKSTLDNKPHEAVVTILFCDLCDFTAHTERLGADAIGGVLNTFFRTMTDVVFEENGTIDKFIGDAIMVLFGAPQALTPEQQARHALTCAQKMQKTLQNLNMTWQRDLGCSFQARIGIHQGPVIVGSFGSNRRSDYTVVGIAVNTAARVEAVTAPDGIWITQEVRQYIESPSTSVGTFRLKGLEQPLELFQVGKAQSTKQTIPA